MQSMKWNTACAVQRSRRSLWVGCALFACGLASATEAELEGVYSEIRAVKQLHQRAGEQVGRSIESEQQDLANYLQLERQLENRRLYNSERELQVRNQRATVLVLKDSLLRVERVQDSIPPLLSKMVTSLGQFVARDLPFSQDVRLDNIALVRDVLVGTQPLSQKVSAVLDLYETEMNYGRTIDAYADEIDIEGSGTTTEVKILRWGRVSMMYQTADNTQAGLYNSVNESWQPLSLDYRNELTKAVRMADKLASLDLVLLPVKAPIAVDAGESP